MQAMVATAAMMPTVPKWVSSPLADLPMIAPDMSEAKPAAICCTEELKLMKLPRKRGSTLEVINAMAGTKRPETKIMNRVVVPIATTAGTFGKCVTNKIGTMEMVAITPNTWRLP